MVTPFFLDVIHIILQLGTNHLPSQINLERTAKSIIDLAKYSVKNTNVLLAYQVSYLDNDSLNTKCFLFDITMHVTKLCAIGV